MENRVMIAIAGILFLLAVFLGTAIFVALFLTARRDYPVPVADRAIPANTRITENHLATAYLDEPPPEDILTDEQQIIGMIAGWELEPESRFVEADLRDYFELFRTTRSIPAGNRIEREMLELTRVDHKPGNAVEELDWVLGKMVREGIPAQTVIRLDHVYVEEHQVVVADRIIRPNSLLRSDQLTVERRPGVPEDAISSREELVGRAIRIRRSPGEVIRETDLYDEDLQLSYFIPMYRRAVGIPINPERSVSHMIRPGDLVDLYVYQARQYSPAEMDIFSGTGDRVHVLQKVADGSEVLALNSGDRNFWNKSQIEAIEESEERDFTYDGMTLALTLKEAEKVSLIKGMKYRGLDMRFYVILRPRILESQYGLRRLTDLELFDRRARYEVDELMKSRPDRPVEVIQGDRHETYRVPDRR